MQPSGNLFIQTPLVIVFTKSFSVRGKEKEANMNLSSNTLLYCSCRVLSAPSDPEPIAFALHCQNVPDGSV
jgi:hypothetical protein